MAHVDEIIAYNKLSDVISEQLACDTDPDAEPKYAFKKILAYEHVHPGHHCYQDSICGMTVLSLGNA